MPIKLRPKDVAYVKKGTVRQNWSAATLYNLSRLERIRTAGRTFFQQKYKAKQITRVYHGEHLTKRQWQNIFKTSLKSVVPMNTKEMASSDGSEFGAGRGSGLTVEAKKTAAVPYMNQTFAPMERRLDMAIFRAMFASSALQARQFVIHGFVKVNGQKMPHPQYMLNPGDMFSVDLDKVLFATGAPKGLPRSQDPKWINRKRSDGQNADNEAAAAEKKAAAEEKKAAAKAEAAKETDAAKEAPKEGEEAAEGETKDVKVNKKKEKEATTNWWDDPNRAKTFDPSKPYRTPWRPRYFLSAFAFIPKYLEVNHNIGHAVYLRDPVAKPGQSEVPTPFHSETLQLAYAWFLRRR
ncbi:hypothetical protein BZA77DRAFT_283371 [Pyronema omphalodes]|nr:hypothetical protein BZA77DRAFT_283371 [Pyronema omphalodes]